MYDKITINDIAKETLIVLDNFEQDVILKIPQEFIIKLNNLAVTSKKQFKLDNDKVLLEQNISQETKNLMAYIYYTFIANSKEQEELIQLWNDNQVKNDTLLSEKYSYDKLFESKKQEDSIENSQNYENTQLMKYKESTLKKILNKIKSWFKNTKKD